MVRHAIDMTIALVVIAAIFTLVERRWAALPCKRWWRRRGLLTDVAYWFLSPLATGAMTHVVTFITVLPIALALGAPLGDGKLEAWMAARRAPVSLQPVWLQVIEIVLLTDFLGYWLHRAFHRRPLFRFHAIHHAVTELDWLSAMRAHPVNEAITRAAQLAPLFVLGFHRDLLAGVAPLFGVYALGLHANLRWTFGPLRYVIASPVFHRWHHSAEDRGLDKNFAGLLPIWDILFGTFYMPEGEQPAVFGVRESVPDGFFAQLVWPFRRAR